MCRNSSVTLRPAAAEATAAARRIAHNLNVHALLPSAYLIVSQRPPPGRGEGSAGRLMNEATFYVGVLRQLAALLFPQGGRRPFPDGYEPLLLSSYRSRYRPKRLCLDRNSRTRGRDGSSAPLYPSSTNLVGHADRHAVDVPHRPTDHNFHGDHGPCTSGPVVSGIPWVASSWPCEARQPGGRCHVPLMVPV